MWEGNRTECSGSQGKKDPDLHYPLSLPGPGASLTCASVSFIIKWGLSRPGPGASLTHVSVSFIIKWGHDSLGPRSGLQSGSLLLWPFELPQASRPPFPMQMRKLRPGQCGAESGTPNPCPVPCPCLQESQSLWLQASAGDAKPGDPWGHLEFLRWPGARADVLPAPCLPALEEEEEQGKRLPAEGSRPWLTTKRLWRVHGWCLETSVPRRTQMAPASQAERGRGVLLAQV